MKLCILWHMHQPFYKNLVSGRYEMPWVRLHGIKDYYDMVAILDKYPDIKQTFNLVPSLLEQIEEYSRGEALDDHLELSLKDAFTLSETDKMAILDSFFKANHETMIKPSERYNELYGLKQKGIGSFNGQDWLDLQVWSNLAWIDPIFHSEQPIKSLLIMGRGFSEDDKKSLLDFQKSVMGRIIPKYKEVAGRGQVELSVTPYFHPILPLLYDSDIAREAVPQISLPDNRFARPEDAELQVKLAIEYFEKKFGFKPKGMWPSEGSVSEQIVPILAKAGIKWIATDEEILALSLGMGVRGGGDDTLVTNGDLYQPYKFSANGSDINLFFRDHALSDLIGFVYSRMSPEEAADDFISKLESIETNLRKLNKPERVICIALDGENVWEYFPRDGHEFLDALYARLSEHPSIETATFSEVLDGIDQMSKLKKLHPGSWINHDFGVWIGHPEDNKAWDLLYDAREALDKHSHDKNLRSENIELAKKEILIAEGSDWCWWFGDEHDSPDNDRFDLLYRSHLINVYKLLGLDVPPELFKPIRTDYIRSHLIEPIDFIKPTFDGKLTHFYEWASAGFFDCQKAGSTMHKADRHLSAIYYGYGKRGEVYIRIDPAVGTDLSKLTVKLDFTKPDILEIDFKDGRLIANNEIDYLEWGYDRFLEVGFNAKDMQGELSSVQIKVFEGEKEVERWPIIDTIPIRPDLAFSLFWTA
ncbi:MAG: glycoside hydrolase [candidate division Zixibacteria bacterium]|nr:glycoside hydrolase [candidate division Zixibacteria bacterium]